MYKGSNKRGQKGCQGENQEIEEIVAPRQLPKKFAPIFIFFCFLLIPAQYLCINLHSNRLQHTEQQLIRAEDQIKHEKEQQRMMYAAFTKAYAQLKKELQETREAAASGRVVIKRN